LIKIILFCITILICVGAFIYFSPYQTFMRDCRVDDFLGGDMSDEYCTWLYNEFRKTKPITELFYLKCTL
jgi:hypothetical protein